MDASNILLPGQQRSGDDGDEDDSAAGSGHVTGEWLARKPVVAEYPISIKICISPLGLKYLIHCCGSPPSPISLAKHHPAPPAHVCMSVLVEIVFCISYSVEVLARPELLLEGMIIKLHF